MLDGSKANVVEAAVEGEVGEDEGGVGEEGGKGVREEGSKERRQVDKCLGELKRNVHRSSVIIMTDKGSLTSGNPHERKEIQMKTDGDTMFLTDLHQIGRLWQRLQQR